MGHCDDMGHSFFGAGEVLGFELRALYLLGNYSIIWAWHSLSLSVISVGLDIYNEYYSFLK
jgi:hypothetical protein